MKRPLVSVVVYVLLYIVILSVPLLSSSAQEEDTCFNITHQTNAEVNRLGPCHLSAGFNQTGQAGSIHVLAFEVDTSMFDPNRVVWLSVCIADPNVSGNGIKLESNELEPGLIRRSQSVELGTFLSGGKDCQIQPLQNQQSVWLFQPIGSSPPAFMVSVSGFPLAQ